MIDGPGTGWALVMCDQLAILYTPLEYCKAAVLPATKGTFQRFHMWVDGRTDLYQQISYPRK
jgi:hypothetical protein